MHAHLEALASFLRPLKGVEILGLFELTIGRVTYQAVQYRQTSPIQPGCPAYDRGERESIEERFLVAGALPPSYVRNPGSERSLGRHYAFEGVEGEWFVAGYLQDVARLDAEQRAHHPQVEGQVIPTFYLGQWTTPIRGLAGAKITKGQATPIPEEQAPRCGGAIR